MRLTSLHLILTYQCTFECDHCFVWGSPWQEGTMQYGDIQSILYQAKTLGTIDWIYFEGGEPTILYPILLKSVQTAHSAGFNVGLVSNAFWATSQEDAVIWLQSFKYLVQDFSISSDLYHYSEKLSRQAQFAAAAAAELGIPTGVISIASPDIKLTSPSSGMLLPGESCLMYRGRAAVKLAHRTTHHPWAEYDSCPHEDLVEPGRVHIDPLGNIHICQGISLGNIFQKPLIDIVDDYSPHTHPILATLHQGGPAALVEKYEVPHEEAYADACHLCYSTRIALRDQFPDILTPDQVYGVYNSI